MSGMRPMRALIKAWESSFLGSWGLFAVAAIPGAFSAAWALVRLSPNLNPIDFAEWAVLTVAITVLGSISQLGLKPGYMQYVTDHGKQARYPGLSAAILMLSSTGFVAGLILFFVFSALARQHQWVNTELLPWLGPLMLVGNITMMLHTDLRIQGKSSVIAAISFIQVPVFIGFLELALLTLDYPLTAFFAASTLSNFIFILTISVYSRIRETRSIDLAFLKWAIVLGFPAMGALLSKYASDLTVYSAFRWLASDLDAGLFGFSTKLIEPLMALYIGSFQMAWGAFIYSWIKADKTGQQVRQHLLRAKWLGIMAPPVAIILAVPIWLTSDAPFLFSELGIFFLMCLSRATAFGVSSPAGVGQTIQRSYVVGLKIHMLEFALTIALVPVALVLVGPRTACLIAALLPWSTVALLYQHSERSIKRYTLISAPVSKKS